jgi:hypothetical protein
MRFTLQISAARFTHHQPRSERMYTEEDGDLLIRWRNRLHKGRFFRMPPRFLFLQYFLPNNFEIFNAPTGLALGGPKGRKRVLNDMRNNKMFLGSQYP